MSKLFTLTVPDVLWINLQVTGAPQSFDFATLEEGTFYQFKTGVNSDFAGQAARFLTGFHRLSPFAAGNEATAFIGCIAFLEMNGHTLNLSDKEAAGWAKKTWADPSSARAAVEAKIASHHSHVHYGVPDPNEIVEEILERFPKTVAGFSKVAA